MSNVIQLIPNRDVPTGLRNIADAMEAGEYPDDGCTLIIATDVFYLGAVTDEQAAADAVFDMTYGLHKMMNAVMMEGI